MLEILLIIVFAALIFSVQIFWLKLLLLIILIGLLIPGMYAMIKGAPFIITDKKKEIILKLGGFGSEDFVCDLGCGDGSLIGLITDRGAKKAVGYEFSIPTYLFAKLKGIFASSKAEIKFGNFWSQDFSQVDVIVCFLLDHSMRSFEKKYLAKIA